MNTNFVAERYNFAIPRGAVDRRNHLVRGVRVVAERSKNKRRYPANVTAEALALYNAPCNIGHHFDERTGTLREVPADKKFGRIVNARVQNNGINGDLDYNPAHQFAEPFLWAAENNPALYSFSVLKRVKWKSGPDGKPFRDSEGCIVAERVLEVRSVDIVDEGGCTSTIFESYTKGSSMFPLDAKDTAGRFTSPGQVAGWLTDFIGALSFSAAEMEPILAALANTRPKGSGSGVSDALVDASLAADGSDDEMMGESRRFIRRIVNGCPFVVESSRKPPIEPVSVAGLVSGYTG